jgi:predicted MFS family arabinose efflux permease
MSVSQAAGNPAEERRAILVAGLVIVVGVIATTLPQVVILAYIPLQNLLKNALHADRSGNAAFLFWTTMPWNLKPLVGLCEDALPIFGSRRKSYLMIGGALATLGWFALWLMPIRYAPLLTVCVVISSAMVVASTAIGGYMVEAARVSASSGRLTSLRNFSQQFSVLVAGPGGGLLGALAIGWTAITCGSIAFLIVPVALWGMREQRQHSAPRRIMQEARAQFRSIGRAGTMWAAAGIAALFYVAPGVFTALFYIQQNDLHMNTEAQGFLQLLNGAFGMLAALLYGGVLCRRFTLRTLLMVCMVLGAIGNLAYWFYATPMQARIAESIWGFGFTMAEVAMMHLMVRATPAGSEALGFSLLMAVRNFCLYGSNWAGSYFIDHWHLNFHVLVLLNGGTSLLAVPLVLLLPKAVTMVRDGVKEAPPELTQPPPHAMNA